MEGESCLHAYIHTYIHTYGTYRWICCVLFLAEGRGGAGIGGMGREGKGREEDRMG